MRFILYAVPVSVLLLASCTSQPILNLKNSPLPARADGSTLTIEEVQRAILEACNQRGWGAQVQGEGVIAASILVRSHSAAIEIHYTASTISILYQDSTNLDQRGDRIHRGYNHWVATLHRTIMRNLGSRAQYY